MQQAEPQPLQLEMREPLEGLLRAGHFELFALVDQRAHDVGLAALTHLVAHSGPRRLFHQRTIGPVRDDRGAAGWHLVEHAHVEIAVHRHRRGTRDRRGRHHQHVGHEIAVALGAQRGALLDAEAMLFVDHDDAEAVERHRVLDERVRADRDVDRAIGETGEHVATLGTGDAVGEQLDPQRTVAEQVAGVGHVDVGQQPTDASRVLLGEHLGGCHQGSLMLALYCRQHRADRDQRLARTDIALQ